MQRTIKTSTIKKDDYQADVDIVEKISFADGKIHFRTERQTGMDLYKAVKGDLLSPYLKKLVTIQSLAKFK